MQVVRQIVAKKENKMENVTFTRETIEELFVDFLADLGPEAINERLKFFDSYFEYDVEHRIYYDQIKSFESELTKNGPKLRFIIKPKILSKEL